MAKSDKNDVTDNSPSAVLMPSLLSKREFSIRPPSKLFIGKRLVTPSETDETQKVNIHTLRLIYPKEKTAQRILTRGPQSAIINSSVYE